MEHGHFKYYTAAINKKTGEATSNISNFYNGIIPIGDNFLDKFKKAYGRKLKEIRAAKGDLPLASNTEMEPSQADLTDVPPNTDITPPDLSESEQDFPS